MKTFFIFVLEIQWKQSGQLGVVKNEEHFLENQPRNCRIHDPFPFFDFKVRF